MHHLYSPLRLALSLCSALAFSLTLSSAHAETASLYDWQPCPKLLAKQSEAQPKGQWEITLSPYTLHWSDSPEHKPVRLVSLDRQLAGGRFCGLALFTNSFGQPTTYAYAGQQWDGIWGQPKLFGKVTAGLIYGYHGAYKNKIPLNQLGIAPAIIPSLGYAFTPNDSAQVFLLGTAGLLFAYAHNF